MALKAEAESRGVTFIRDDRYVSVGMGAWSRVWPAEELPDPNSVAWEELRDVPVAVITGTNGKSTTTRLLAAMCAAAGKTAGFTSTDFVKVGKDMVETGDWAGPMGARLILRHRKVEIALLEPAAGLRATSRKGSSRSTTVQRAPPASTSTPAKSRTQVVRSNFRHAVPIRCSPCRPC